MSKYNQKTFSKKTGLSTATISRYTDELKKQKYQFEHNGEGRVIYKEHHVQLFKDIRTMIKENQIVNMSMEDAIEILLKEKSSLKYWTETKEVMPIEDEIIPLDHPVLTARNEIASAVATPLNELTFEVIANMMDFVRGIDERVGVFEDKQTEIIECNMEMQYETQQIKKQNEIIISNQEEIKKSVQRREEQFNLYVREVQKDKQEQKRLEMERKQPFYKKLFKKKEESK